MKLDKAPASAQVLLECIDVMNKKSQDYQNPNSSVQQADYYPRGIYSMLDIIHAKYLRALSVCEAMENDDQYAENFESLEDSLKDLINYAAFAVSWTRGDIEGQNADNIKLFTNKKPCDTCE